ncbi:MAG TPA: hypothetical protein VH599_10160 [Ktedonobacterales bacterium]
MRCWQARRVTCSAVVSSRRGGGRAGAAVSRLEGGATSGVRLEGRRLW